jgi:hypothetical protein
MSWASTFDCAIKQDVDGRDKPGHDEFMLVAGSSVVLFPFLTMRTSMQARYHRSITQRVTA